MVQRIGGLRRKTRNKLKKNYKVKGKTPLRKHLQEFKAGQNVILQVEPSVQGGMYNLRFHGQTAKVVGKNGGCYDVTVMDGNKQKTLIVNPVHLRLSK